MFGPAADELAELWKDRVRTYRLERQTMCVKKAGQMLTEVGITPSAVPPKLLFPLLEGASFEDNEDLHTMWAALLANAAIPDNAGKVRPAFIATLRQMAPDEAALLNAIEHITLQNEVILSSATAGSKGLLDGIIRTLSINLRDALRKNFGVNSGESETATETRFQTCLQTLEKAGLIVIGDRITLVSYLGHAFLEVCLPPKP